MKSWYRIEAKAEADETTVFIYDEIGLWGITAKDFIRDFEGIKAGNVNLRVNSPGGDVFDGIAIFNSLKNHKAKITTQVDGLAASIASVIAMAGDEITIAKNAFFMIHNAWALALGSADEMRKMADTLEKIDGTLVKTYADRTGQTQLNLRQMMSAETWMNADEAVDLGFADSITVDAGAKAAFDLSKFRNVPKDLTSEERKATERDIETLLRDAGVSRKSAMAAVAAIKSNHQRDTDAEAIAFQALMAEMETAKFQTANHF